MNTMSANKLARLESVVSAYSEAGAASASSPIREGDTVRLYCMDDGSKGYLYSEPIK